MQYILNDAKELVATDILTWGKWFSIQGNRRVAETVLDGDVHVSTVFLGLDHQYGDGPPLLYETMVFGGDYDQEMNRYSTWAEAEEGHRRMVAKVQKAKEARG